MTSSAITSPAESNHVRKKKTIDERFDDVIGIEPLEGPDVETFPVFYTGRGYIRYSFKKTRKAWLQQFGPDGKGQKIIRCLREAPTTENVDYLKKVRSRGIMLRNAYKFFDQSHRCPQDLKNFVHDIGVFADNADPSRAKVRQEAVRAMLDLLEKRAVSRKKALKIRFVTTGNFRRYALSVFDEVRENLRHDVLETERFHDTRKLLRQFSNLMQIPAVDNIGKAPHWLCLKLHRLSAVFGNAHAQLVAMHLPDKGYREYEFPVERAIHDEFERLIPYLEKAIGT